jgi:hypothetical protein
MSMLIMIGLFLLEMLPSRNLEEETTWIRNATRNLQGANIPAVI